MADPDLVKCPDCFGRGSYLGQRCSLCQGKGGINWHTGESVPAKDVPPCDCSDDFATENKD